jgi:hypothetical protein
VLQKNWKELIKPQKLDVEPGDDAKREATVVAEPLERGFGLTLGNALRRVLLSSLQGAAITSIKIDGVPLYKLARKGEEVVREPRFIRVMSWDTTRFALPEIDFRVRCTKGTYVRTLAHDLGEKLGCGGHLSALRRTATDKLTLERALTLEQINALTLPELEKHLLHPRDVVPSIAL